MVPDQLVAAEYRIAFGKLAASEAFSVLVSFDAGYLILWRNLVSTVAIDDVAAVRVWM